MNTDLAEYRDEIDRLERMAIKLENLGMEANGYEVVIEDLRTRLVKFEKQFSA